MVFKAKGAHTYKLRVTDLEGRSATLSTGTRDTDTAEEVEAMVTLLRQRRQRKTLRSLVDGDVTLAQVFDTYRDGELKAVDELLSGLEQADLSPLVAEWGKRVVPKAVTLVRSFIPEGEPFPVSRFRRREISEFLAKLEVSGSTRNRYKSALSVFARRLVEREVLETNVVRDVASYTPNPSRLARLERTEAKALLRWLPQPYRALEALMAGSGVEWQAVARATRRDFDLERWTFHAHGGKNRYRDRIVKVTETWTRPAIRQHLERLGPNALVFEGITVWAALAMHKKGIVANKLLYTTLHDWRHSYAVNNLRDGMKPAAIKRQLGHAPNSTLLERVYGVWIVTDADYPDDPPATNPATSFESSEETTLTGVVK